VVSHELRLKKVLSYITVNAVYRIECISTQIFNKKGIIYVCIVTVLYCHQLKVWCEIAGRQMSGELERMEGAVPLAFL